MRVGEANILNCQLPQRLSRIPGRRFFLARRTAGHGGAEATKAVLGHGGNEGAPIREVPVGRGLTHTRRARYRAESEPLGTFLTQDLNRCVDESLSEIAVVIGASC
jgi:hypothetical protein